ncbi:Uncharacterized protein TPAR_08796 [Tolypocladium paradoxum]|uniref:HpcH/HpaI aldolase/citrate lyase domain-containing protein n=1 Tax=Tolypocladium paradoxum TaxID=94208 RepID=A0A2S4KLC5_9HYPO|nr:Uncharacterized protein TPAR_08796 [Tolypocladium paradoxum]
MAQASSFLRRALLYVPGASQKMLDKSCSLKVDSIIYDLEDSVLPEAKDAARSLVSKHIFGNDMIRASRTPDEVAVRVNGVKTGLALQDITEIVRSGRQTLDTIVLPKVESAAELHFVADVIRHIAPTRAVSGIANDERQHRPLTVLALIESARGLCNIHSICREGRALGILSGIAFAAEDFAADLSLSHLPDRRELLFARSSLVTAARAFEVPSIVDLVSTVVPTDAELKAALAEESLEGRALGFTGKQCIHPQQVGAVQAAFGPSEQELEWAVRVDIGDAAARREGKGAWRLDGKMVDAPVLKRARELLQRADKCGIDTMSLRARLEGEMGAP